MDKGQVHSLVWLLMSPTALLSLISMLTYFAYRFYVLIKAQQGSDSQSLVGAWFYLALEALTLVPSALPYLLRILAVHKPNRTRERLEGDNVPTVDVLVTCCGEELDVILDTVRAACALDYPQDRYRIFVCDDGGSAEVQKAVDDLSYSHVFYNARIKGPVKDYKAGNLNAGLRYSASIPYPGADNNGKIDELDSALLRDALRLPTKHNISEKAFEFDTPSKASMMSSTPASTSKTPSLHSFGHTCSEYVAGLDADMIPEPHWLRTILPHMIKDPTMGLACPPQTFYDLPTNDPLNQTMDHFAGITEVVNDSLGHADCLGSGYVMRRSAINSIGGFPVESLSEDVCCSATLLGAGWSTAFVQEPLQYGSVPESFFAHVKQRTRWFVGHVQTAMLFKLRFFGARGKQLNVTQKIAGLAFDLGQIIQVPVVLAYFSIPFALLSGYPLVNWTETEDLRWLMRLASMWMLLHWIHQGVMGVIAGLGNGQYDIRMASYGAELDQWLAPYIAESFFRSFILPSKLGGRKAGFTSTGSLKSDLHERDAQNRAPLHRRLYITMLHNHLLIHVIFVLASLTGVALTFARVFTNGTGIASAYSITPLTSTLDRLVYMIVRIGWPPLMWLQYVLSCLSPILYVFFPPTVPDREKLLIRDEKTGIAYPTPEARRTKRTGAAFWRYLRPALAMGYTVGLLVVSTLI